jgi:hypothetical protein
MKRLLLGFFLTSLAIAEHDSKPTVISRDPARPSNYTLAENIQLPKNAVVFFTHLSWSRAKSMECPIFQGADVVVRTAAKENIPVLFLEDVDENRSKPEDAPANYAFLCRLKKKGEIVFSQGGKVDFKIPKNVETVISGGGFCTFCQKGTIEGIAKAFAQNGTNGTIILYTPALMDGSSFPGLTEAFKQRLYKVNNSDNSFWTFAQILDLFPDDRARLEHLVERAKHYAFDKTTPDHQVILEYRGNGKEVVIQKGKDPKPKTLRLVVIHPPAGSRRPDEDSLYRYLSACDPVPSK